MAFPIQFSKPQGDYDIISPLINFSGNAAVAAVGGIGLGIVTFVALKALGFKSIAAGIAAAIPVAGGVIAAAGAVVGVLALGLLLAAILKAFSKR